MQGCATARSSGAVRVRRLAQGHLGNELGGAGDQTSNLPVSSQPALPPEPLWARGRMASNKYLDLRFGPVLTYCILYVVGLKNSSWHFVASYPSCLCQ